MVPTAIKQKIMTYIPVWTKKSVDLVDRAIYELLETQSGNVLFIDESLQKHFLHYNMIDDLRWQFAMAWRIIELR